MAAVSLDDPVFLVVLTAQHVAVDAGECGEELLRTFRYDDGWEAAADAGRGVTFAEIDEVHTLETHVAVHVSAM